METVEQLKRRLDSIRSQRLSIRDQISNLYNEMNNAPPERREMIGDEITRLMDLDAQLATKEDEIRAKLEEIGEQ